MKKIFDEYKIGFDFWSLILYALLILPYIVYWCMPAFSGLDLGAVTITAQIFGGLSAILLTLIKRRKREKKLLFDSAFTSLSVLLLLYFTAWILLFCGKTNFAITFFIMLSPCLAFILLGSDRKNIFCVLPVVVFTVLQVVAAIQLGFSL